MKKIKIREGEYAIEKDSKKFIICKLFTKWRVKKYGDALWGEGFNTLKEAEEYIEIYGNII